MTTTNESRPTRFPYLLTHFKVCCQETTRKTLSPLFSHQFYFLVSLVLKSIKWSLITTDQIISRNRIQSP
ncbi:hypothetical protein L596_029467 [Steinernema carpocapsae]|uniref:Uncharacterized protein n=1 Tax=Steinernema carpocapsae TaxID=34508 RepID=A0A4U5LUQ4_STECR|nr:hypothetical protein L596_029467 [Steinernema carpocapsae]